MTEILRPDLCVLGGGAGGLAAARTAAGLGAEVVLIEKRALGGAYLGEALPAQAFCAAAAQAAVTSHAGKIGAATGEARVDLAKLRAHLQAAVKRLAVEDLPARLAAMNIRLIRAAGFFTRQSRIEAGGFAIDAKDFIIATGATRALPAISGLEQVRLLTPESLPFLEELPKDLIIIGSSFHGLALAQAFVRLGTRVTLLEFGRDFAG